MKRRTDVQLTAEALLAAACHMRLDWPGKTVHLERNSLLDYQQRPVSAEVSIAELYHENSKLYRNILGELVATHVSIEDFRNEFIRRRAALVSQDSSESQVDHLVRTLLTRVASAVSQQLFYAVEIRIRSGDFLLSHDPLRDALQVVKHLSPEEIAAIHGALQITEATTVSSQSPVMLLLGSLARNEILFGRRGYRHTLLEAGQVTAAILAEAEGLKVPAVPIFDFIDREIDAVMEADGIEEATLVAIVLGERLNVE